MLITLLELCAARALEISSLYFSTAEVRAIHPRASLSLGLPALIKDCTLSYACLTALLYCSRRATFLFSDSASQAAKIDLPLLITLLELCAARALEISALYFSTAEVKAIHPRASLSLGAPPFIKDCTLSYACSTALLYCSRRATFLPSDSASQAAKIDLPLLIAVRAARALEISSLYFSTAEVRAIHPRASLSLGAPPSIKDCTLSYACLTALLYFARRVVFRFSDWAFQASKIACPLLIAACAARMALSACSPTAVSTLFASN